MLSILIPIYHQDVRLLVTDLHFQCTLARIEFEIIIRDDHSQEALYLTNSILSRLSYTSIFRNEINMGRSITRNLLIDQANHPLSLLIDGDSMIIEKSFIKRYLSSAADHPGCFIYGGTVYPQQPPSSESYLHWYYGTKKEALLANIRQADPYRHFHSNNYLAPTDLHNSYSYDELIKQYGYEDYILGYNLRLASIPIVHIDNRVKHTGLKSNVIFLSDQRKAIKNLVELSQRYDLSHNPPILFASKVRKYGLLKIINGIIGIIAKAMNNNLLNIKIAALFIPTYKVFYLLNEQK